MVSNVCSAEARQSKDSGKARGAGKRAGVFGDGLVLLSEPRPGGSPLLT